MRIITHNNYLEKVEEFHRVFRHPVLEKPQIPNEKRAKLRVDLLQEELDELKKAIADNDIVSVFDAFADLQYVLSGAILEFGGKDVFPVVFNEVHRSNMSKLCSTEDEAWETIALYKLKGVEVYVDQEGDKFHVKRKNDDKTLKSINYLKADIKSILEQ